MSIVGMIIHRNMTSKDDNYYIMSADTRVVNRDNNRNLLESSFESAAKIIKLTSNTLVGICGEYQVMSLLQDIKEKISKYNSDLSYSTENTDLLKNKIFIELQSRYCSHWSESDLFFLFQDYKTNKTKAWKLTLPSGVSVELDEGLHLIGGDAYLRANIKKEYNENFKVHKKCNLYIPNHYADQLLILLKKIEDEDIGSDFITYYIKPDGGVDRLNNFEIFKKELKIISMTNNDDLWQKSVNNKKVSEMINDCDKINMKLRQSYKSK
ncbi:hypothetical protein ACFLKB_13355 [Clostridium sp. FAM 1755]|uniref:hypothetical protein n=1 Tax=Clostridium caseinilyticum TaxID=3350403 RepID=UPI0038F7ECD5